MIEIESAKVTKKFPNTPRISVSDNYKMFSFVDYNRPLDRNNLKKLIEENTKEYKLNLFPILVDKNYNIIDGQHRFAASVMLGYPIFYIKIEDKVSFEEITSVNRAGKRHTISDMVQMGSNYGDPVCRKIMDTYELMEGFFDIGTVARVLCTVGEDSGNLTRQLRDTKGIKILDHKLSCDVMKALKNSSIEGASMMKTCLAAKRICSNTGIDPQKLIQRIAKNHNIYKAGAKIPQVVENMLQAYNYDLNEKNRLYITKWSKFQ